MIDRFNRNYIPEPNTGCWLWTAADDNHGYGVFRVYGKNVKAHRWAYEHFVGPIPAGINVCHRCDIPSCVNPDHLFLGTQAENLADMRKKGRDRSNPLTGAEHPRPIAKITETDVLAIRSSSSSQAVLAAHYGVHQSNISKIINRHSWRHI